MATSTPALEPKTAPVDLKKRLAPYFAPYYLAVGTVLGGITVVFVVLTLVIVLVATNFNVLALIE